MAQYVEENVFYDVETGNITLADHIHLIDRSIAANVSAFLFSSFWLCLKEEVPIFILLLDRGKIEPVKCDTVGKSFPVASPFPLQVSISAQLYWYT